MIVAKKLRFLERFSSNFMRSVPPKFEQIPKTSLFVNLHLFPGRRHRRNLPMAKATDGLGLRHNTALPDSGVPPLPPTSSGLTSDPPPPYQNPCNLQCILRMVFKNIVFYGVSCPSWFRNFILVPSKKPRVLRGFGVQGGPRNGTNDMLTVF